MPIRLNTPTAELIRIDVTTHPLFVRLWRTHHVECVTAHRLERFCATEGLVLLCLADDPVKYKESLDLAAITPDLAALFEGTLSAVGFSHPDHGRAMAARWGLRKLPAVALFCHGRCLGGIEGLRTWDEYQKELVRLLLSPLEEKTIIPIHPLT